MNRSSPGGNPPQEEPIRTKRDELRGRNGKADEEFKHHPDLREKRAHLDGNSFEHGDGSKRDRPVNPPGKKAFASKGLGDSGRPNNPLRHQQSHGDVEQKSGNGAPIGGGENSPRKKRRRGRRKKNRQGENAHDSIQLRNIRAPARPAEDVTFDPTIAKKRSGKRKNKKHSGRQKENLFHGARPDIPESGQNAPRRRWDRPREQKNLYAALDLGTNNCRLLVALPQEVGRFRVVDAFSRIVRLGEGLAHTGRLSDEAMDRSFDALKICAGKLRNKGIRRFRLIATEACRQAENGDEFLERVRREIGLQLEIVNRETEARLAAEGCGTLMDQKADGAVLFDIGGGSSELILIDRNKKQQRGANPAKRKITDRIAAWTSLPMGVVTLAERFGGREVSQQTFDMMVDSVVTNIEKFEEKDQLSEFWDKGRVHLLGTSGTVTTIAGVHLELPKYDRRKVDGVWLQSAEIDKVISKLIEMDYEQRAGNPCIGRDRADLVLAGCAILEAIRKTWPCERLRVADRGLREGLLTEMISKDGAWINPKRGRRRRKTNSRKPREKIQSKPGHKDGLGNIDG